ncbi:Gfo/Idh/MocA family protein [Lacipirellula parvula]|uniref:Oxidoreductase n=1 Tax=Lacipirellula parvula TaxID=2650471 RepID=A0A5K7XBB0_9BACT|nr:Gfo/Idh/MocA family oxidoreductase [Lacipirellula parvula]BBO33307.1 oxidoreductase [Lacipirellula parvula]
MASTRRDFLAASAGLAAIAASRVHAAEANSEVVLAIMGANNRGSQLAEQFAEQAGCRIAYICDPDEQAIAKGITAATSRGAAKPQGIRDFRHALDDPTVDALICAAPNHWHAPATILACKAGKHVYVEKPCSHTAAEGEMMIAAANKSGRVVQVGMQRRSGSLYRDVISKIRDGAIGAPLHAKSWYHTPRPSIGRGQKTTPPASLDYALWQGPSPERPFQSNAIPYNWHFFWQWGNGEIGNNGVHSIDICRLALGVDYPTRVTCAGGRLRYDDDQETPDTSTAIFECGDKLITWEQICWMRPIESSSIFGIEIRGTEGALCLNDEGAVIYDLDRNVVEDFEGSRGDAEHLRDFLDAVRDGHRTAASIEEGHKSALFCHLGNIAYRTGQSVDVDATTGRLLNKSMGQDLWSCEYREGWAPAV